MSKKKKMTTAQFERRLDAAIKAQQKKEPPALPAWAYGYLQAIKLAGRPVLLDESFHLERPKAACAVEGCPRAAHYGVFEVLSDIEPEQWGWCGICDPSCRRLHRFRAFVPPKT